MLRARSPVIRPSRVSPSSANCTAARPCIESIASLRVSVHATGRPSARAAATIAPWVNVIPALPPKAPPTCGATTRSCCFSRPVYLARRSRVRCGCWVATYAVRRVSPSGRGSTRIALPSIGAVAIRWFSIRARTTSVRVGEGVPAARRVHRAHRLGDVAADLGELQRGAGRQGLLHVDDHVEQVVVDVHELRGVHRLRPRLRDDERDRVADVAHDAVGQRPVPDQLVDLRERRHPLPAERGGGVHGQHAGGLLGVRGVEVG